MSETTIHDLYVAAGGDPDLIDPTMLQLYQALIANGVRRVAIDVTAAEIAEGVRKAAIPALDAGKGPILVAADFLLLAGDVPFAGHPVVNLEDADENYVAEGDAGGVKFDEPTSTVNRLTPTAVTDTAGRTNGAIDLVIPAAGYRGAILTHAIADAGSGYKVGDTITLEAPEGATAPVVTVDTVTNAWAISGLNSSSEIMVDGDRVADFGVGDSVTVYGSTGNDGTYEILGTSLDGMGHTVIEVDATLPSAVADGYVGNDTAGPVGVVATYTLTEPGTASEGDGQDVDQDSTSGVGEDFALEVLTVSEDSDGTGRLLLAYYGADLA